VHVGIMHTFVYLSLHNAVTGVICWTYHIFA